MPQVGALCGLVKHKEIQFLQDVLYRRLVEIVIRTKFMSGVMLCLNDSYFLLGISTAR